MIARGLMSDCERYSVCDIRRRRDAWVAGAAMIAKKPEEPGLLRFRAFGCIQFFNSDHPGVKPPTNNWS